MPDKRLAELLRQRSLLSQHVAWLDAEIAHASGSPPGSADFQPTASHATSSPIDSDSAPSFAAPYPIIPAALTAAAAANKATTNALESAPTKPISEAVALANKRADDIIASHSATDKFNPESTRRSCVLLAVAFLLIGTATIIGIYLLNYR